MRNNQPNNFPIFMGLNLVIESLRKKKLKGGVLVNLLNNILK